MEHPTAPLADGPGAGRNVLDEPGVAHLCVALVDSEHPAADGRRVLAEGAIRHGWVAEETRHRATARTRGILLERGVRYRNVDLVLAVYGAAKAIGVITNESTVPYRG